VSPELRAAAVEGFEGITPAVAAVELAAAAAERFEDMAPVPYGGQAGWISQYVTIGGVEIPAGAVPSGLVAATRAVELQEAAVVAFDGMVPLVRVTEIQADGPLEGITPAVTVTEIGG